METCRKSSPTAVACFVIALLSITISVIIAYFQKHMAFPYMFYIWLLLTLLTRAKDGRRLDFFYKVSNAAYYVLYASRSPRCLEGGGFESPTPAWACPVNGRAAARVKIVDSSVF